MKTKEQIEAKFSELTKRVSELEKMTPSHNVMVEWRAANAQLKILNWVMYGF